MRELMCPTINDNENVDLTLKFANAGEIHGEKPRKDPREGNRRAQTKEVETDTLHYSNEYNEVCNETFSDFDTISLPLLHAGNFACTRSIFNTGSKN